MKFLSKRTASYLLISASYSMYADAIVDDTVLSQRLEHMFWITSILALGAITFLILWKKRPGQPIWIKYCAATFSLLFFGALIALCYTSHTLTEHRKYHKVQNPFAK